MPEASTVRVTTSPPGVPNRQIDSAIIRIRVWFDPRVYHALLIGKFPQIGRIMVDCIVFESNDLTFRSSSILNMPGISVHSGRDRIMTGGKERTAKRFELPLVAADLQFLRVIPTDLPTIIIEAEPH